MNQTKPTYKQQGNVGLFDSDETIQSTRRENNMGFQGGIDKGGSFWAIVQ